MAQITVSNLGKAYKKYPSHWARLYEWILPGRQPKHELHWVLNGIDFSIFAGEAVGIIGINGAGKSTLLKLITGTTQPTIGSIHIEGRVAALLELGMGFHPDFTGRQNVYMAGQLLGLSEQQITFLMPEIEEFADIGNYIDEPVRVYSSGMQMRLAFSVATAQRPDVLIVDEALSVGDAYFQHKSFERIRHFRSQGTTLLIVSHDKQAIVSICDRAILLSQGRIEVQGEPETVIDYYNAQLADHQNQRVERLTLDNGKVQTISGTGEVNLLDVRLLNQENEISEMICVGESIVIEVDYMILSEIPDLTVGFMIKDRVGNQVFGTNTYYLDHKIDSTSSGKKMTVSFSMQALFGEGSYSLTVGFHSGDTHMKRNYEWRDLALVFGVVNTTKPFFTGLTWMPVDVQGEII